MGFCLDRLPDEYALHHPRQEQCSSRAHQSSQQSVVPGEGLLVAKKGDDGLAHKQEGQDHLHR